MRNYLLLLLFSVHFFFRAPAQILPDFNVVVEDVNGFSLKYPWAGGLNNPQFSDGDFNNDGIRDLLIFDRTGNKAYTFINHGTPNTVDYEYAAEYEKGFPALRDWALLRDYNCDGIPDIFTYTGGPIINPGVGIQVYRGYYSADNKIQFVNADSLLRIPYDTFMLNLYVSSVDIPAIVDVNGDGDLDILTFQITGGFVIYYENQSMELLYACDSLIYFKMDDCWGDFYEPSLQRTDLLDQVCPFFGPVDEEQRDAGHTGSVETAWDNDGDGDVEFLKGDISFSNLSYLTNGGTASDAHMIAEDTSFPSYDVPADVFIFPAPFLVDVNNNGLIDLLVAPDAAGGSVNLTCSWHYNNVGNPTTATFSFQTNTFLNGDMIDVGEGCFPVFFDADSDSLPDMIIGNRGYFDNTNQNIYIGELSYYKNIGDAANPVFRLVTKDYANISALSVKGVYPAFGDMDGDGDKDLLLGQEDGSLLYFKNTAPEGDPASFIFFQANYANADVLGNFSTPQIVDVNRDGLPDILMGEQGGNLDYFQNTGTLTSPDFSSPPNTFFGGVDVRQAGYFDGFSAPFLYDENDGNGYQLLVGSKRGWIYRFINIDNNLEGVFTLADSFYSNINTGANSTVSGADANNDGKTDFLIGNFRGGVTFYNSKITATPEEKPAHDIAIRIFPNPANQGFDVIVSSEKTTGIKMELFDLLGNKWGDQIAREGISTHWDVQSYPTGIYLLRVNTGTHTLVQKIIVSH